MGYKIFVLKNFIKGIPTGIINLIKWMPIVWKDRDFDHGYLYDMLQFKLKNMEDFFYSDYTWCANSKRKAKEIKTCRILLDRIVKEEYVEYDCQNPKHTSGMKYFKNEGYMLQQDLDMLFNIMRKKSQRWWD